MRLWLLLAVASATVTMYPWTFDPYQAPKTVAMLIVGLALLLRGSDRVSWPDRRVSLAPVWIYLACWSVAALRTMDWPNTLVGQNLSPFDCLTAVAAYTALFAGASRLGASREDAVDAVTLCAVPISVYAVLQAYVRDPLLVSSLPTGRVFSTMGSPVYLGAVLAVASACAASTSRRRPVLGLSSLALCAAALWHTRTRGAMAAAALGVVAACPDLLPAAVASAIAATFAFPHKLPGVVNSTVSDLGRLETWKIAWRMFRDHPLTGVGPGAFDVVFRRYIGHDFVATYHNLSLQQFHGHDGILHAAATTGVVGLVGLAALWLFAAAEAVEDRSLVGVLVAYAAVSVFNPVGHSATAVVAIVLGTGSSVRPSRWRPWPVVALASVALVLAARGLAGDYYRMRALRATDWQSGLTFFEKARNAKPWDERLSALAIGTINQLIPQIVPEDQPKLAELTLRMAREDVGRHPEDELAWEVLGRSRWVAAALGVMPDPAESMKIYDKCVQLAPTWLAAHEKRAATAHALGMAAERDASLRRRTELLEWEWGG